MSIPLDASKVQDINDCKGGNRPLPGRYHVVVAAVSEVISRTNQTPGFNLVFEVLQGTVPNQHGTQISETFWVTEKAVNRLKILALATGVLQPGQKANADIILETPGRQLVIDVETQRYTGRDGEERETVGLGYDGLWPLDHPDVCNVPCDEEARKLLAAPVSPPVSPAARPSAVGGDPYADL